jgi:hypothetical protein
MHLGRPGTAVLIGLLLVVAGCATDDPAGSTQVEVDIVTSSDDASHTVIVHRSATCDCCGAYEDYLEQHGWLVEQVVHDDLVPVKDGFGVPARQRSCHTSEVGGYAVEGHVPVEAIEDLLARAPDVDGISLAGMPAGSPGMPGEKQAPFEVMLFRDGEVVGDLGAY